MPGGRFAGAATAPLAVLLGVLSLAAPALAQEEEPLIDWSKLDFSGYVAGETRIFPQSPQYPEQKNTRVSPSLAVQPELRYRWNRRDDRITFVPFLRLDADDENR
ncbi:hypothetical protein, partial [Pelagibius marinus]|uniref:hypothetical protein n=1 Tax=Pelagibius marinus TaxID=2762760 RepID=UPI001D0486C5